MERNVKEIFKVGQRVEIHSEIRNSYGFDNALPMLPPEITEVGEVGIILKVHTPLRTKGCSKLYPDVLLELENGKTLWLDICFLTPITPKPVVKRAGAAKSLTPQCRIILKHLKQGFSITQRSALMDFGVMALPRRICDLKEAGHKISSVMEYNSLTGQKFARYSLTK